MKSLEIKAQKRESLGKKNAGQLREKEMIPGVLYGKDEVVHLFVPFSELRHLIYTPNVFLVDLNIDGVVEKAMIQDLQWHPVEEKLLHVDFLKIKKDKPVKIYLPVKISGMAKGIKAGGKLKVNMRQVRVKAFFEDLPDVIEIDVTKLGIGNSIKVGDLKRDNIEFLDNKSNLIVAVVSTRAAQSASMLPEETEAEQQPEGEQPEGDSGAAE